MESKSNAGVRAPLLLFSLRRGCGGGVSLDDWFDVLLVYRDRGGHRHRRLLHRLHRATTPLPPPPLLSSTLRKKKKRDSGTKLRQLCFRVFIFYLGGEMEVRSCATPQIADDACKHSRSLALRRFELGWTITPPVVRDAAAKRDERVLL